jgi:hypothetical protein
MLKEKVKTIELKNQLYDIVPLASMVNPDEIFIYEFDEALGIIKKLQPYNSLPSDENQLNSKLDESNELFAQLLEIQQGS